MIDEKLRLKIKKALIKGDLTPYQLSKILTFRTKKSMQKFIDTVNAMYSKEEIMPYTDYEGQQYLLLRTK